MVSSIISFESNKITSKTGQAAPSALPPAPVPNPFTAVRPVPLKVTSPVIVAAVGSGPLAAATNPGTSQTAQTEKNVVKAAAPAEKVEKAPGKYLAGKVLYYPKL